MFQEFCFLFGIIAAASCAKMVMLIDTDAGIDDAQAILMAIADPDVEIVGITTVSGNTAARQVSLNVLRLLKVAGRSEIPVYEGSSAGVLGLKRHASYYHGEDGFGDVPDPNAPDASALQEEHGVSAIVRLANKYEDRLVLVALGPLTNIALALRIDPDLKNKVKFYFMGGNHFGKGNTVPTAEFNFLADPEGAFATLNGMNTSTVVTWETCLAHTFSWRWFERFLAVDTTMGRFIAKIYQTTVERFYQNRTEGVDQARFTMADQIIMSVVLAPKIVLESEHVYSTVELSGRYCRGQMVVDWNGQFEEPKNSHIVTKIDKKKLSNRAFRSLNYKVPTNK